MFHYIIIGAGSAGCVLAARLSEDASINVLLLEAGPVDKKPEIHIPGAYSKLNYTKVDWGFYTEPQQYINDRCLYIPRGKTLGGSSSTNAMAYVRGNKADYDEWESLGNKGWSYAEVLPLFKKSEHNEQLHNDYHGDSGPLNVTNSHQPTPLGEVFVEACTQCGIKRNDDYNGAQQCGASPLQFTIKNNQRHSTAAAFLKPVLYRKNLTIKTNAQVKQVLIENDTATGVEILTGTSATEKIYCSKEIILSAGAIQSPQLLMLSGIGDKDELTKADIPVKHHLPGTGKNLQDHLWSGASRLSTVPTSNRVLKPLNMGKALLQHLIFKKGPLANSPLEANAFLNSTGTSDRPDIQFHFTPSHIGNDYRTNMYDLSTFATVDGFSVMCILLRPASRGFITLKDSNPKSPPIIQPCFLSAQQDADILLTALKKGIEVMQASAFDGYSKNGIYSPAGNLHDDALKTHILKSLETLYHPVGTCKMGNDAMSVVNAALRVHGIAGLRIIDASIMPTIVSGNTNAPSIMIAEKGAELIKLSL
ncbi:MAG: GMC family oxidoreductase N-terminal domain-containing protein [Panacibacter sp.]